MRVRLLLISIAMSVLVGCAYNNKVEDHKLVKQATGIFDNYIILGTPVSDLAVGARWNSDLQGTIDSGLPKKDLQSVSSIGLLKNNENTIFATNLEASLSSLLGLNVQGDANIAESLEIKNIVVVKVANIESLDITPASTYLWEGIKVTSFTATTSAGKAAEVKAKVIDASKDAEVAVSLQGGDLATLKVNSANLFVAYKVVGFERIPSTSASYQRLYDKNTVYNLYSLDFMALPKSGSPDMNVTWSKPLRKGETCFVQMVSTPLYSTDEKKVKRWRVGCPPNHDGYRYELGSRITKDRIYRDQILLDSGLTAWVSDNNRVFFDGGNHRIFLEQFVMSIKAVSGD